MVMMLFLGGWGGVFLDFARLALELTKLQLLEKPVATLFDEPVHIENCQWFQLSPPPPPPPPPFNLF